MSIRSLRSNGLEYGLKNEGCETRINIGSNPYFNPLRKFLCVPLRVFRGVCSHLSY